MKDFTFRNDTKLYFLNDIRETLVEIINGHRVMLVYGGASREFEEWHQTRKK